MRYKVRAAFSCYIFSDVRTPVQNYSEIRDDAYGGYKPLCVDPEYCPGDPT